MVFLEGVLGQTHTLDEEIEHLTSACELAKTSSHQVRLNLLSVDVIEETLPFVGASAAAAVLSGTPNFTPNPVICVC